MKRSIKLYIDDINTAVEKVERYVEGMSFEDFLTDEKTVDSIVRNFEILGEAAKNIPEEVKIKYSDVPWNEMIGMRNKIIHEYFGVDHNILWKTIKDDLPQLKPKIKEILESLQCSKDTEFK